MSENNWEDYRSQADYSCDPYTYYFLWSNFGSKNYDLYQPCSAPSYSRFNLIIGFVILLVLALFGI